MFRSINNALLVLIVALIVHPSAHSGGNGALKKTPHEFIQENTWRCRGKLRDGDLEKMEERLVHRELLGLMSGVLMPDQDYICVLIEFYINDTGGAENLSTVDTWPTTRLERFGYRTLIKYKFTPSEESELDGPFYELFELTWGVEPELDISKLPELPELPEQEEELR